MQIERHIVFWIAALAVFVALLWLLSPILLPFVLGMALAYVLDPLADRLTKRGLSRLVAASIILGGFVLALALLLLLIAPVLARQLAGFIDNAPGYAQRLQGLVSDPMHPWLKRFVGDNLSGGDHSVGDLMNQAMGYVTTVLASLWTKGQTLISIFSLVIITPVVAFYLICDWDSMVSAADSLIPLPQRDTVRRLGHEIDATISAYVRGQSGLCLILGSYYAVGLTLAGLSFGLLIAVAQFFPDWTPIVIVAGVVLVGQFLEGNVLAPYLVGHSVGLHPVWLMFALFAFGYLFGFVGLLLAVPLAAAAGVLIRFAVRRYRASPLYTGSRAV
jgi:predicted PurR-regulated permease PerM